MIKCPIVNKDIDEGECVAIVDVSEGCTKESILPQSVTKVENWKDICKKCEYHDN